MSRGIRASKAGQEVIKDTLRRKGWTQEYLAGAAGCARQTVVAMGAGRPIESRIFQAICQELGLDWGEIAEFEEGTRPQNSDANIEIDRLILEVRAKVAASIQRRCGTMRVLDMEQAITIDSIYTSVNILGKIPRNQRRTIEELLTDCELEDFDRFTLGRVQTERIPGREAVQRHGQLMILGKPGAGKTTFLKWLALQCQEGQLHGDRVPFFVPLKEFAEAEGRPGLLEFMAQQLAESQVPDSPAMVEQILRAGRSMVLLDGLDEVRETDHDRILATIRDVTERFYANQFIITCRIAAREYTFEKFTEVQIADFDQDQIAEFARKWFQTRDAVKAEAFPRELMSDRGLQELATNPLLLTLLCLVYEAQGGFPANRSELYKEGLDVLLKKWDVKRNIKREEVYKKLSLKRKEDLLSRIAYITFTDNSYFFKQKFLEQQIQDYIRNLPNAQEDEEALQLDSEAVLKLIEAQHGLLVERARSIYSFSHLTFQEYFTARYIKEKSQDNFGDLVSHIKEKCWREVFLLTVGMLDNADQLVIAMKQKIDDIMQDTKLQQFLLWLEQKSRSVQADCKPAALRAYYFAQALDSRHSLDMALDIDLDRSLTRALDRALDITLDSSLYLDLDRALKIDFAFDLNLDLDRALANKIRASELKKSLQELQDQLLKGRINSSAWWESHGQEWTEKLRAVMIEHRNIGHNWQFTVAQREALQQYYDANQLLVDCLNSDCYLSRSVRAEIENTLLLPIASIQQLSGADNSKIEE